MGMKEVDGYLIVIELLLDVWEKGSLVDRL